MTRKVPSLAVLCSGYGTNFQAILRAIRQGRLKARVGVMVSDSAGAFAIQRALKARVPAVLIDPRRYRSREAFDRVLAKVIDQAGAHLIILAGFMRILSPWFIRCYQNRILNIHPALLPAFPGTHAVKDALDHGVKVTGVTVHFVDEKVDHGPIILQEVVPVLDPDSLKSLLSRIHRVEHRLYPKAIQWVLDGRVKVIGRRVRILKR